MSKVRKDIRKGQRYVAITVLVAAIAVGVTGCGGSTDNPSGNARLAAAAADKSAAVHIHAWALGSSSQAQAPNPAVSLGAGGVVRAPVAGSHPGASFSPKARGSSSVGLKGDAQLGISTATATTATATTASASTTASTTTATSTSSTASLGPTATAIMASLKTLAACMREHGVAMPEPVVSGGAPTLDTTGVNLESSASTSALTRTCRPQLRALVRAADAESN